MWAFHDDRGCYLIFDQCGENISHKKNKHIWTTPDIFERLIKLLL